MCVADICQYENKRKEFEMMEKVFSLNASISKPIEFGISKDSKYVFSIFAWVDIDDAE